MEGLNSQLLTEKNIADFSTNPIPPSSFQQRPWLDLGEECTIYLSGMLHLPQESYFIMALAALFPLKTTSRTTINLECLTGTLPDMCVCILCQCVCVCAGVFPRKGCFSTSLNKNNELLVRRGRGQLLVSLLFLLPLFANYKHVKSLIGTHHQQQHS